MRTRWEAMLAGDVELPVNDELGFTAVDVDDPAAGVVYTWSVPPELCNSAGNLQGGVLAAFADAVLGSAGAAVLPEDRYPALAEMKISIFRSAPAGTSLTGTGKVLKQGRRLLFIEAEIRDERDRLIAKASGTEVPAEA